MEVGVHLPQVRLTGEGADAARVGAVVDAARERGFAAVAANDHLAFARPWLDGPSLLAAAAGRAGTMELATTVALPVVRGPVALAATLATLDVLAPGRVLAGVGPGSSAVDHHLAGSSFEERWRRFDDAVPVLRSLLRGEPWPASWGEPPPPDALPAASVATGPVPVWVASWGSPRGLRRVAELGDGWLASAYNTTPDEFAAARDRLSDTLAAAGRTPLPTAVATMWTYVTDEDEQARRILDEVLAPVLRRSPDQLTPRVCVGPPGRCAELLARYAEAGCGRVYLWPVTDELDQLELVADRVLPQLPDPRPAQ